MENFSRLVEFRQLPVFKSLKVKKRKAIITCFKNINDLRDGYLDNGIFYFRSRFIGNCVRYESNIGNIISRSKTIQNVGVGSILNKLSTFNYCLHSYRDIISLYYFSFIRSKQRVKYLYHCSDVEPDIILRDGIIPRYSLNVKSFPSLVFLSSEPNKWVGKYCYKILNVFEDLYIDTNIDWKGLDKTGYFCIKEKIDPGLIIV